MIKFTPIDEYPVRRNVNSGKQSICMRNKNRNTEETIGKTTSGDMKVGDEQMSWTILYMIEDVRIDSRL